jgi:uncharacterized cofD-like protein
MNKYSQGKKQKTVVVMGGGTGTFTVLSALRPYKHLNLKAVVAMTDDGGSSGVLRDELGVLPPGDIRQCLVALSESPAIIRRLMNYRFENGGLKGHSFGNVFLSALEKVTGSFDKGLEEIGEILKIHGEVIPATLDKISLVMVLKNGAALKGERVITPSEVIQPIGIKKYYVRPKAKAHDQAIKAILSAKAVVIGPGNLYTSLIPLSLIQGIPEALKKSKAKKILIVNLVTKFGQMDGFSIFDFTHEIEKYLGKGVIDVVLFNTQEPPDYLKHKYLRQEKSHPIIYHGKKRFSHEGKLFLGADLLDGKTLRQAKGDNLLRRNLIRHNPIKLGKELIQLINKAV